MVEFNHEGHEERMYNDIWKGADVLELVKRNPKRRDYNDACGNKTRIAALGM